MTPVQWNMYVVDLEPRVGTKPGKQRPVIVIQPSEFAEAGLGSSVILPVTSTTSSANAWPLRVTIPKGACGLTKNSEVMIDQIIAWHHAFFKKDLGALPQPIVKQIKAAVREFLDL
jgi:mRNA interferase MazF